MEKRRFPEWLKRWLNMSFYSGSRTMCEIHPKKFNTVYCASCTQQPVCLACWDSISDQHVGDRHRVLKVETASRRVSIDAGKISKYLNVREIQPYSINGHDIVFLNPNAAAAPPPHDPAPKCRTCRRRLKKDGQSSGYRFCSISCKCNRPREEEEEEVGVDDLVEEKYYSEKIKDEWRCKTSRKRRKPRMSPLKCDNQHQRRSEDGDLDAEKMSNKIINEDADHRKKPTSTKKRKSVDMINDRIDECRPPSASATASVSLRKRRRKMLKPRWAPFK